MAKKVTGSVKLQIPAGKATPGRPDVKAEHNGVTYRFASDENRRTFSASPDRYVPQFGGFCANGMVYAIPLGGEPENFKIIDGKLYLTNDFSPQCD